MALNGRVGAKKDTQYGIEIEDVIVLVTIYTPKKPTTVSMSRVR